MISTDIPSDTTLETLITQVLPDLHSRLVSPDAVRVPIFLGIYIEGGSTYTLTVRGSDLEVTEKPEGPPSFWFSVDVKTAQWFLNDWLGAGRFRPPPPITTEWVALTDPKILSRLAMVNGCLEFALNEADGTRRTAKIGLGAAARKSPSDVIADVVLEASVSAFEKVLVGTLGPDEAITNGDVRVEGRKLLGLQFALAIAPFFPKAMNAEG